MIKWSRRIKRRSTILCPKCRKPATVMVFEGSDSAYVRCYNKDCDSSCSTNTFHRLIENELNSEAEGVDK